MAGEIVEVNTKLNDEPDTINKDAMGSGWIAKVADSSPPFPSQHCIYIS